MRIHQLLVLAILPILACGGSKTSGPGSPDDAAVGATGGFSPATLDAAAGAGAGGQGGAAGTGGTGQDGGVGTGGTGGRAVLSPAPGPTLAVADQVACAIHGTELRCWGSNKNGQMASTDRQTDATFPVVIPGASGRQHAVPTLLSLRHDDANRE